MANPRKTSIINSNSIPELVEYYRKKAMQIRWFGYKLLWAVAFILIAGLGLFLFAGIFSDIGFNSSTLELSGELTPLEGGDKSAETIYYERLLQLVSVAITRIGSVLILIFLVQILLNLYRYLIRLSNHFDAIASALMLCDSGGEAVFNDLVQTFSPTGIDLSKSPDTPLNSSAELLKALASLKR